MNQLIKTLSMTSLLVLTMNTQVQANDESMEEAKPASIKTRFGVLSIAYDKNEQGYLTLNGKITKPKITIDLAEHEMRMGMGSFDHRFKSGRFDYVVAEVSAQGMGSYCSRSPSIIRVSKNKLEMHNVNFAADGDHYTKVTRKGPYLYLRSGCQGETYKETFKMQR